MRNNNKRSGAYFGLHFDFHAEKNAKDIGSKTLAENIGKYLDAVKPDYIQVDTKGHYGYASYFTEYGDIAPGLTHDHLKIIREETEKRRIALIAHHSSIWEELVCATQPEWALTEPDGTKSGKFIDFNSPYVDKKFVFMIKELCGKYGFDGAWIDGDCWCVNENYSEEYIKDFLCESGFDSIDRENPDSPSHLAFRKYCKDKFAEYVKYYIGEIKKEYPDFEITSNTAFTSTYPKKPFDEVDFLSADICGLNLRAFARCFASHNKPWDIMSWGRPLSIPTSDGAYACRSCNNHLDRSLQFAASVISLGGGFQIIGDMTAQGEITMYDIPNLKKVSEFMQERKQFNYRSVPLENAAILVSESNRDFEHPDGAVCPLLDDDCGTCDLVIDSGRPVDIIFDYHIEEDKISGHSTIIIQETAYMPEHIKEKLVKYIKSGGNLIVTGANTCKIFGEYIDADIKDFEGNALYVEPKSNPVYAAGVQKAVIFENYTGEELCNAFAGKMDHSAQIYNATAVTKLGKGQIAFVGWDIISEYYNNRRFVFSYIMKDIIEAVDRKPNAYLKSGVNRVELIPAKKDDMLLLNVINTNEYYYFNPATAYGDIPPVIDIEVAVKCDKPPVSVMLEPEHRVPEYSYDGEYVYVKIDKVNIHTIITVK